MDDGWRTADGGWITPSPRGGMQTVRQNIALSHKFTGFVCSYQPFRLGVSRTTSTSGRVHSCTNKQEVRQSDRKNFSDLLHKVVYLSATSLRVGVVLWIDVPAILRHVSVSHSKRAINKRDEDIIQKLAMLPICHPKRFQKPA